MQKEVKKLKEKPKNHLPKILVVAPLITTILLTSACDMPKGQQKPKAPDATHGAVSPGRADSLITSSSVTAETTSAKDTTSSLTAALRSYENGEYGAAFIRLMNTPESAFANASKEERSTFFALRGLSRLTSYYADEDALRDFKMAYELDPNNYFANLGLGRLLAEELGLEKSSFYLRKAVANNKKGDDEALLFLAGVLSRMGRFKEAAEQYNALSALLRSQGKEDDAYYYSKAAEVNRSKDARGVKINPFPASFKEAVIDFCLVGGGVVADGTVNGKPAGILFDTGGSGDVVMSRKYADGIGLKRVVSALTNPNAPGNPDFAFIDTLTIKTESGPLTLNKVPVVIRDVEHDVRLGMNILGKANIVIDYKSKKLFLYNQKETEALKKFIESQNVVAKIPLNRGSNFMWVPVAVYNEDALVAGSHNFVLDTGAGTSLISIALASKYFNPMLFGNRGPTDDAGIYTAGWLKDAKLVIGGVSSPPEGVGIAGGTGGLEKRIRKGIDGLVGNDIFGKRGLTIVLSFSEKTLYVLGSPIS